jgi:8-oxo-dGTP pyrophosphatase MutT (NUDIX family)
MIETTERGRSGQNFNVLLKKFKENQVPRWEYRRTMEFRSPSERKRMARKRSFRRARRLGAAALLAEFRDRKLERGTIPVPMRSLRLERMGYDGVVRRSMVAVLLNIRGEVRWMMLEKTDPRNGRRFLSFVGGKSDSSGEGGVQTAVREVMEESNLDLSDRAGSLKLLGEVKTGEKSLIRFYLAVVKLDDVAGLRPRPHEQLVFLTNQKLGEEIKKPGRVSLNAQTAINLFLASK